MSMFEFFVSGLGMLLSLTNLLFINIGLLLGIIFGAIPGLTVILGLTLFIPFTFAMEPITSILFLLGIYCGGSYGGSITAILINTPGTPAAAATLLDGYPATKKGLARKALDMALIASVISGLISATVLLFAAPPISRFTVKFGPPEYFCLALFGLSIIAGVSGESLVKGIIAGAIGILISFVGMDPITGITRFTFHNFKLMNGIPLVIALIGLFALTEIFNSSRDADKRQHVDEKIFDEKSRLQLSDVTAVLRTIIRSSFIGTLIGSIPGTGAVTSSFISYSEAKRRSKHPEEFGKGSLEGVAAAEAGNNGVTGATLIPLLTLGIPGDGSTAVLFGALLLHGMVPGPSLFVKQGNVMYAIMIGLIVINLFMFLQGKILIKQFAKISNLKSSIIAPIISIFCFAGAYSYNNSIFDVSLVILFSIVSYALLKMKFSLTPLLLGLILGPIAELNFRRSMAMSDDSLLIFFTRPISIILLIILVFSLVTTQMRRARSNKKRTQILNSCLDKV